MCNWEATSAQFLTSRSKGKYRTETSNQDKAKRTVKDSLYNRSMLVLMCSRDRRDRPRQVLILVTVCPKTTVHHQEAMETRTRTWLEHAEHLVETFYNALLECPLECAGSAASHDVIPDSMSQPDRPHRHHRSSGLRTSAGRVVSRDAGPGTTPRHVQLLRQFRHS